MCRPFSNDSLGSTSKESGRAMGGTSHDICSKNLILLFTSLLAIPLACQCCFDTALLAGFQIIGMTLHFLDDVFLLYLAFKPAQCVLKRFAFLQANLGQRVPPPNLPERPSHHNKGDLSSPARWEISRRLKYLGFAAVIVAAIMFLYRKCTPTPVNSPSVWTNLA